MAFRLRWSVPGLAHVFTFWTFVIVIMVHPEVYGALLDYGFHIPGPPAWRCCSPP
jgi:hypothetical protein